jgi:hypothetical protein
MQQTLIAGDTLKFYTSVPAYPAGDGWTLKYRLIPRSSGSPILISASAYGSDYEVNVAAATTATWTAAEYSWASYVEKAGERYTVEQGTLTVKPNPGSVSTLDSRTDARKILDSLLALHQSNAVGQGMIVEYSIAGRSVRFRDTDDLLEQIRYWRAEVAKEERAARIAAGQDSGATLRVTL